MRFLYLRRVNPNRVHLSAELHVDDKLESDVSTYIYVYKYLNMYLLKTDMHMFI
jgi:hypothetical protein